MTPTARVKPQSTRKPKLGQNFLADHGAAQKIVDALGDISQRTVIEIGPGKGAITALLAKRARRLIAIEFDRLLATQLRFDLGRHANVEIIEADVLAVDFHTIVQGELHGTTDRQPHHQGERARVVGNLPYYITSDILLKLFAFHANFDEMVLMVQKEVADRLAAEPGSRDFGLLTATTQLYAEVQNLFTLPPSAFSPPPKVYSSVVRLKVAPKLEKLGVEEKPFIAFLKQVFAQKRKTLANNLRENFEAATVKRAMAEAKVEPAVRAEALSVEKLAAVYRELAKE